MLFPTFPYLLNLDLHLYSYCCQVVAIIHVNGCQEYFVCQGDMIKSENSIET
jgi:hypothetical protein